MQAAYQYPLIIGAVLIVIYLTAQYFKQGGIPQMLEYFKGGCQKKPKEIKIVTMSSFGQVNGAIETQENPSTGIDMSRYSSLT